MVKYPKPTKAAPMVLPYSALVLFRRCRKAYELGYELNIETGSSQAAVDGTEVHEHLAQYARDGFFLSGNEKTPMLDVAKAYIENRGLPGTTLMVEEPIYTKLIPNVYLRTTLDRVYRDSDSTIVGVDYKTFERAPTIDFELDPQGGLYIAALMRHFKTDHVRFEYEYIRRSVPGSRNSKGFWSDEDCYTTAQIIISKREADLFWREAQETARDIVQAKSNGRWYRSGTRVEFGSPCLGCFYKSLCIAEKNFGVLTDDDVAVLAKGYRDPLVLPTGVK